MGTIGKLEDRALIMGASVFGGAKEVAAAVHDQTGK